MDVLTVQYCGLITPPVFWPVFVTLFYHINYDVTQEFIALGKTVTTHHKKYDIFSRVWYRQSATDMSLAFRATRSGWWMKGKAFTILNPRLFVKIFSDSISTRAHVFSVSQAMYCIKFEQTLNSKNNNLYLDFLLRGVLIWEILA